MKRVHPFHMRHFARAVKGVDLKSTAETRVGSSPAGDDTHFVCGVVVGDTGTSCLLFRDTVLVVCSSVEKKSKFIRHSRRVCGDLTNVSM